MKFSTKTTNIPFFLSVLFLFNILTPQDIMAQACAQDLETNCSTSFITINADFDSSPTNPHSDDCPPSIIVSDGSLTATLIRQANSEPDKDCSSGINGREGYLTNTVPSGFDCKETEITITMATSAGGTLTCSYSAPGGLENNTNNAVLPVELISFKAFLLDDAIKIHWETASEINNKSFTIEKSTDGRNFESIGEMDGAGFSFESLQYVFVDKNPVEGHNYYRLTQTDYDGKSEQFEIVLVEFSEGGQISAFPNPVADVLKIGTTSKFQNKPADIYIQDMSGKVIFQTQEWVTDGPVELDLSSLRTGMYVLSMTVESKVFNKKIVKN